MHRRFPFAAEPLFIFHLRPWSAAMHRRFPFAARAIVEQLSPTIL